MKEQKRFLIPIALAVIFTVIGMSRAEKKELKFEDNFDTAAAAAKEANKPMIVIFSAAWCAPCLQMKNSVYPSKKVQKYHDSFVWAYLDADKEETQALMGAFGVNGLPHITFLRPDGSPIRQFVGAVSPFQFSRILKKVLSASKEPAPKSS